MKFLTDANVRMEFVQLLRMVGTHFGWTVETAYEAGIHRERHDYLVVAWARNMGAVLLTFDEHRRESGQEVAREIRRRGGKVIRIAGGPEQPAERAMGKLLFHRETWDPFLTRHDGVVTISDLKGCKALPRSKMRAGVTPVGQPMFVTYIDKRGEVHELPRKPRRARPVLAGQLSMDAQHGG